MLELYLISFVIVFIISSGISFAYFQREYLYTADSNRVADMGVSLMIGVLCGSISIIGLILVLSLSGWGEHGFKFPFPKLKIEEVVQ